MTTKIDSPLMEVKCLYCKEALAETRVAGNVCGFTLKAVEGWEDDGRWKIREAIAKTATGSMRDCPFRGGQAKKYTPPHLRPTPKPRHNVLGGLIADLPPKPNGYSVWRNR